MHMKRKYKNKSAAEKKIRQWLEDNNKTIVELAEMLGVSDGTILRWFKGEYIPSSPEVAKKLKDLCGVECEWLI